jgi:hypothetical protein
VSFFPRLFRLTPRSVRQYQFQAQLVGLLDYSLTEQDTGRKWVDGKSIFQKTVAIAAGPNNSTVNVAHGITGLDTIVTYEMMLNHSGDQRFVPNVEATAAIQLHNAFSATNIILVSGTGGDYHLYSGHCTLYYTKS